VGPATDAPRGHFSSDGFSGILVPVNVRDTHDTPGEARRLGARRKGMLALGVACAVGLATVSVVLGVRRQRISETRENVEYLAAKLRARLHPRGQGTTVPPPCDGKGWDEIGQAIARGEKDPGYQGDVTISFSYQFDAWDRWIVYRSPGPVHTHGWDFYSFGPNGIDEHGGGDDIVVGEDVAEVASTR
jgi:hypothetical protein